MQNPIIVALDVAEPENAWNLARKLTPFVGAFKVGKELFTRAGPDIVRRLRSIDAKVFLDLKFHDIPNTVARAVAAAVDLEVFMLTVHASGGVSMMQAAEESAQSAGHVRAIEPPLILGVTVLTSLQAQDLQDLGVEDSVGQQVQRLARLAGRAGLRGLVCSPLEIAPLRQGVASQMQLVTPGIRPQASRPDDQKRTLDPAGAIRAGANWLVIGRPIIAAPNPALAAESILSSLHDHH